MAICSCDLRVARLLSQSAHSQLTVSGLQVYDVSSARHMYGPEGGYSVLCGRDASRVLAQMTNLQVTNSLRFAIWLSIFCAELWATLIALRSSIPQVLTLHALQDTATHIDDLSEDELATLNDWAAKFDSKYPVVGRIHATTSSGQASEHLRNRRAQCN